MDSLDPQDLGRALAEVPLFREIQKVLAASGGPINWEIARQIAGAIAGAGGSTPPPGAEAQARTAEACRVAELNLTRVTGLSLSTPVDDVALVDRRGWTEANLAGFRGLLERLASRLTGQLGSGVPTGLPVGAALGAIGPFLFGVQVGFMIGYLSHRVLGQYDLILPRSERGKLYFVEPNIARLETDLSLDPQQFRLWLALHEVTHVMEFEAIGWTREQFLRLVERFIDAAEMDQAEIAGRLQGLGDPDRLTELLQQPDELMPLIMSDEQKVILGEVQAFMSVLEGYAEWAMDEAGRDILPEFEKMREAVNRMRAERSSAERLFEGLIGIDLKREQYRAGERFVRTVAEAEKLDVLWASPGSLPTLAEVKDPPSWLERVAFS